MSPPLHPDLNPAIEPLGLIRPTWAAPTGITAFTTTRQGGISTGPYHSMNLGLHVGDSEPAVLGNRQRLQELAALPEEPRWLRQTHSTNVLSVENVSDDCETDGAYTAASGVVLAVLTADCLPVVIINGQGSELAVVHAGWRGLAGGILDNAIAHFTDKSELQAWLGPAIGPQAFEVGDDVKAAFVQRRQAHERFFKSGVADGKYWCDLYSIATAELAHLECHRVSGGNHCTYTQADKFHSHRRDGVPSGRMATIAWIT